MPYNSNDGLYYNFIINNKERDFTPAYVGGISFKHSIFDFFPTVSFKVLNINNALFQQGLFKPKNSLKIEFGIDENDLETYDKLYIEKALISEARSDLSGNVEVRATSNFKQNLLVSLDSFGWTDTPTSVVVNTIMSKYLINLDIETTKTKGNWIRPNSQNEYDFLKIIKNRSLPQNSNDSKMFMWTDLQGTFHFKSLSKLILQKPIRTLDFTQQESEFFAPIEFEYLDGGVRYKTQFVNNNFNEYILSPAIIEENENPPEGTGLTLIQTPNPQGANNTPNTIESRSDLSSNIVNLMGYSHSLMPTDFFKSIYYNNYYNYPFRLAFSMRNIPDILPGQLINFIFPHFDEDTEIDPHLSGVYLITGVEKSEEGNQGKMTLNVAKNDFLADLPEA